MNYLVTDVGTFGPFVVIETLNDGWLCDGIHMSSSVVGAGLIRDEPPEPPAITD